MTTNQLIARVCDVIGTKPNRNHLHTAMRLGYVNPSGRYPDGWLRFDEAAVADLTRYMEERSRTHRRRMEAEAAA